MVRCHIDAVQAAAALPTRLKHLAQFLDLIYRQDAVDNKVLSADVRFQSQLMASHK